MIIIFYEFIVPDEKMPLLLYYYHSRETHLISFSDDEDRFFVVRQPGMTMTR